MAMLEIDGVRYFSASELLIELGVSRQTLWRWRQQRKIPADEVELIRQYANRIEPNEERKEQPGFRQLGLFNGIAGPTEPASRGASNPRKHFKKRSLGKQ
jgi:hypothetical protein